MRHLLLTALLASTPLLATAQETSEKVESVLDQHIMPRFEALAQSTQHLAQVAQEECTPSSEALRTGFGDAFDAWINVSHLRFGPTEVDERAFALAFWPDSRGATPRSLTALIADQWRIADDDRRKGLS